MARKSSALIASSTQIDVTCSEDDTSPHCIEIASSKKRRSIPKSDEIHFVRFSEKKTFWDAKKFCAQKGMRLARETDQAVLEAQNFPAGENWVNPMELESGCGAVCYSWHQSEYSRFNLHVEEWKNKPSFRYRPCSRPLSFICETTQDNSVPARSCAPPVEFKETARDQRRSTRGKKRITAAIKLLPR